MHFDDEFFYTEEETAKPKIKAKKIIQFLLPYFIKYRGRIILGGFLLLLATGLSIFGPLFLRYAIDVNIKNGNIIGLVRTALFYLLLSLFIFLISYCQRIQLAIIGERATADIKDNLFAHILNLPLSFFDKTPTGKLLTRIESDTEALKNLFTTTGAVLMTDFVMLLGMSIIMWLVNYRLCLLVLVLIPVFSYAFHWFQKRARPVYVDVRRKVAEINNFINEALIGLSVVQAFNQERHFTKRGDALNYEKYERELRGMRLWYRVWFLVDFGEVLSLTLVLGFGSFWALRGSLTIGTLFLFFSYIQRLFGPLRGLSDQLNIIQRALASGERIVEILSLKPEYLSEEGVSRYEPRCAPTAISFQDVSFGYDSSSLILKDINLLIRKGEKVALVGETGGGKTSLVSLLLRFYEPVSGTIAIDNYLSAKTPLRLWRNFFGFVPQDIILFPGSVLDNLRLFDYKISTERVERATQRLGIHERILNFPDGYQTNLIERGINLSVGERQLLSFARALIFDPPVLILDEATSSVDPQTESLLQAGLQELLKERTAIIIAHRLATIQMCDRIIVIHKGRIVEEGTHQELLEKKGFYYKLYKLQFVAI